MNELLTAPRITELGLTETVTWDFDVSARVAQVAGGSVSNPVIEILDDTGATVADVLVGVPSFNTQASTITQTFSGAPLTSKAYYRCIVTFDIAAENTQSAELTIRGR